MSVGRGGSSGPVVSSFDQASWPALSSRETQRKLLEWQRASGNSGAQATVDVALDADDLFDELDAFSDRAVLINEIAAHVESPTGEIQYWAAFISDGTVEEAGTLPEGPSPGFFRSSRAIEFYYSQVTAENEGTGYVRRKRPSLGDRQYLLALTDDDQLHLREGWNFQVTPGTLFAKLMIDYSVVEVDETI